MTENLCDSFSDTQNSRGSALSANLAGSCFGALDEPESETGPTSPVLGWLGLDRQWPAKPRIDRIRLPSDPIYFCVWQDSYTGRLDSAQSDREQDNLESATLPGVSEAIVSGRVINPALQVLTQKEKNTRAINLLEQWLRAQDGVDEQSKSLAANVIGLDKDRGSARKLFP